MVIRTDPARRPVKVKDRRYPAEKRAFLDKYVKELVIWVSGSRCRQRNGRLHR